LAQCWFHGLAISNAKYKYIFQTKKYGSNFSKQHSKTIMVRNYKNADCSLKNNFVVLFIIIFGTLSFPVKGNPYSITERGFRR